MTNANDTLHLYDVLAATVAQEGIDTCFSLLGDANMAFATRLSEQGCHLILVRHEHCAVAAAMAYARKTSDVGLATVTCGPGVTQLMTALPAAVRAHLPLVVVAGEAPLGSAWYNQAIDQAPLVTATGARYRAVHSAKRLPEAVRDAFLEARRDACPVVIGIPFDLQAQAWSTVATGSPDLPTPSRALLPQLAPMAAHPGDVARACKAIDAAGRIVVMAGMGAVNAQAASACRELAQQSDALLATTLPARGLFHDDAFCIGVAGGFSSAIARECLAETELVIAVGCSLARHNADGGALWPNARVLQIDTDPVTLSQGRIAADLHLRADARLGVEALAGSVRKREPVWRSQALAERLRTQPADAADFSAELAADSGTLDPRSVVTSLDASLPKDWELVNSSGHCSYYVAHMQGRPQHRFLTIREFGAIGNGSAFALGVAAACKDHPVVLFDGDGSLLMHIQELETLQRHALPVLIVVFNDGAYGSEIHKLRAEGLDDAGAVFGRPDFAAIAKGFGARGHRVQSLDEIPALTAAFDRERRLTVWDVPISDRIVSPVIRRAHRDYYLQHGEA